MTKRIVLLLTVLALVAVACGTTEGGEGDGTTTTAGTSMAGTLQEVQERGVLRCGVSTGAPFFAEQNAEGRWVGFDADFCRAVAAAVLGDAEKVEYVPVTAKERFDVLKAGDMDVLIRNTTWTQSRDSGVIGIDFGPTIYYDGQQLVGLRSKGFDENSTLADVDGARFCASAGTTTEKNITEGAQAAGATIELITVDTTDQAVDQFVAGACDLFTTDGSGLVGYLAQRGNDDWVIFPTPPISKEPLTPAYRPNDSQWADVIDWVVFSTIIFDEKGVTSANVDEMVANPPDAEVGRLLGLEGELQTAMGLSADAYYQVVKQVGNYDEIFSQLNAAGLFREGSYNAGYLDGGLIYAPPAR